MRNTHTSCCMRYIRTQYNVVRRFNISPYPASYQVFTISSLHSSYVTFLFLYALVFSIYGGLHSTSAPLHSAYAASPPPVLRSEAGRGAGNWPPDMPPGPDFIPPTPPGGLGPRPPPTPFHSLYAFCPVPQPIPQPLYLLRTARQITRTAPVFIPSTPARFIPATLPPTPNSFGTGTRRPPQPTPRPHASAPPFIRSTPPEVCTKVLSAQQGREVPRRYSPATAFKSA